jgi:RNA polymerase sigma factor (sigma-70 family)
MGTPEDARRKAPRPPHGDEADLFREFNPRLARIVQGRTDAPPDIVDDACAFAWQQFMQYQPDRDRHWKAWLVTTAQRELWRLWRQQTRHESLSADEDEHGEPWRWDVGDERDHAAIRLRLREALQAFARLPERRREIKALQVAGFSYEEIAEMRGLSWTRVNHVLAEANAALREHQVRTDRARVELAPRARRLDELEQDPPLWLRRAIGTRPSIQSERAVLAWPRAALAIDDYRREYGRGLGDDPVGERPAGREAAQAFDLASAAIAQAVRARTRNRERGVER